MNKLSLLAVAAAPALLLATPASALDLYGAVRVGETTNAQASAFGSTIDLAGDSSLNAAVGARLGGGLYAEAGVDRDSADLNLGGLSLDADVTTYSGTVGYEFGDLGNVKPYAEVGYGYSVAEANLSGLFGVNGSGWGYHYGFGARAPITENISFDVNYRHRETEVDLDFIGNTDVSTDAIRAGLVFEF